MIPKREAAIFALENGVQRVHILNGGTPNALLVEAFTNQGIGTMMTASRFAPKTNTPTSQKETVAEALRKVDQVLPERTHGTEYNSPNLNLSVPFQDASTLTRVRNFCISPLGWRAQSSLTPGL